MIVNAHCHRNLTDEACVQVSIYDDWLGVSSPGGLYNGLTYEDIMHGRSRLRNRTLANVFNQMGLIDAWGTGIQRIQELAKEYNLPAPEFMDLPESFQVNLYRKQQSNDKPNLIAESANIIAENKSVTVQYGELNGMLNGKLDFETLSSNEKKVYNAIKESPLSSRLSLIETVQIPARTFDRTVKSLIEKGFLIRVGSKKTGHWTIK